MAFSVRFPSPLSRLLTPVRPLARRAVPVAALAAGAPLLGGCQLTHMAILDPKGPIGADEKSIIILATLLMLIVVVPVIVMTIVFAWRYRASNTEAAYEPDWSHSTKIEAVVWAVPCLIILVLGTITWTSSHRLDPYRPIASDEAPLDVDVVSLDWKWLFIYPDQHIASVNELAIPAGRPVNFHLTSATVMNSFFIPRLGSQIYTMAGMETKLSLQADEPGDYRGISANYSGSGFSDMNFAARAMSESDFEAWVKNARGAGDALDEAAYRRLARPSERHEVAYYGDVPDSLFHDILNKCVDGSQCTDRAMNLAMLRAASGGEVGICAAAPRVKGI